MQPFARLGPPGAGLLVLSAAVLGLGLIGAYRVVSSDAVPVGDLVALFAAVLFAGGAVWLFATERLGWACVVIGLYLGLVDGYLKLRTGNQQVALGRDVLIFAVAIGYLARASIRRTPVRLPPLSLWVLAYVALVLVQLLNPGAASFGHSLTALKPNLEFVPLFFLGYAVLTSVHRLKVFMVLLLVCALANGVVSFVQVNLSTDELAGWGPGYAAKVQGSGDVSGRTFTDDTGEARTRPFGLGGDAGGGALMGLVAVGGALAVLLLGAQRRLPWWTMLLCVGPPLALVTGQGRTPVVAAVVAALVFTALAVTARRLVPSLAAVGLAIIVLAGVVSVVGGSSSSGVYDRYKTIAPTSLLKTTQESRGGSLERTGQYLQDFPVGAGLGYVGPAASRLSQTQLDARRTDGETTFAYLLAELGIPGLVLLFAFTARLILGAFRQLRRLDDETRTLVAAVAAGIAGIFTMWVSSAPLAVSPTAPYFWFAAGGLAYWFSRVSAAEGRRQPR